MSFPRSMDQPTSAPTFVLFREHPTKGGSTVFEHSTEDEKETALNYHKSFLSGSGVRCDSATVCSRKSKVDTETTPLFSGVLLDTLQSNTFKQYGLLGEQVMLCDRVGQACQDFCEGGPSQEDPRIFLNVSPPWSAFICGSQGSGKSYTLSCMLENCLISSDLGQLQHPLAGMVFHYDTFTSYGSNQICEAAYLCSSGIPVRVLVSPTNYWKMKDAYEKLPGLPSSIPGPEVIAMKFQDRHLNVTRMMNLMAVNEKEGAVPLYIEVIIRILRQMAIEKKGDSGFDYNAFRDRLSEESFTGQQNGPLKLRLDLLESFLDRSVKKTGKYTKEQGSKQRGQKRAEKQERAWSFESGTLTIVDLSCPFVDDSAACALFNICLELFLESRDNVGRIIALDEAHKFMTSSASAMAFTENLVQVIRQQRHLATRVIIATQEPTISPKLLDLTSMTIVHRFTSPEWLMTLQNHIAGVSILSDIGTGAKRDIAFIFAEIVGLEVGEALVFSPTAIVKGPVAVKDAETTGKKREVICPEDVVPEKLGIGWMKMRVRKRLTEDGGTSIVAL